MGFQLPEYLTSYLNTEWRVPPKTFSNQSQYYAHLDTYFMTYMRQVVRPCLTYACAAHDGYTNGSLVTNVGYSIVSAATKLVKGERVLFNGDDAACAFLDDVWSKKTGFSTFLEQAVNYLLGGGTCTVKLNIDRMGRSRLVASRVDRNYFSTDDNGDVIDVTFFVSLLSSEKSESGGEQYWLVERRYYEKGERLIEYKAHRKGAVANSEVLPDVYSAGIEYDALPDNAKRIIDAQGIVLNQPMKLPFRDGLGVWVWTRTATNSVVPGVKLGDPLLYGALDLLWAVDTVFCGSIVDVLNGKGKTLLPRNYFSDINETLRAQNGENIRVEIAGEYAQDDSLVYIKVKGDEGFEPTSVQFDIRAQPYREMWELYLRQIATHTGFAPTSLFPFLQDSAPKTATEVTAEENLTRATVQSIHELIIPELNRAIDEILYQSGFDGSATVQLSDYIGNKLQRDENIRQNAQAGYTPKEIAVQRLNGLSVKETKEYLEKLKMDKEEENQYLFGTPDALEKTENVTVDYV